MKIEMKSKNCIGCGKVFKVMAESTQEYHSTFCSMGGPKWKNDQKSLLKSGLSKTENENENNGETILNLELKNRPIEWPISKESLNLPGLNITKIQQPIIKNEPKEVEKVSQKEENSGGIGTDLIKNESGKSSDQGASEEIQSTGSSLQLLDSEKANFHLTNLIDSSAIELHSQLKGMFANKPDAEIVKYDPERVNIACLCAKQITNLLRLKLDIYKTHKEVENAKN